MKLTDLQLSQVDAQIKRLIQTDSYYGRIYKEAGITGVSSQEEFEQLPFSSKADLRNAYPLGIQAVPDEEVVRIHSSSGTTGKPVIIPYTARMWMTGRLCLHAAMKQQESQTKTIFRLQPAMVCGRRESDSRQAVRSLAQWQFRWDRVIQISRFR